MNNITINGITIEVPDDASVNIINGVVHINGKGDHRFGQLSGEVDLKVEGKIGSLKVDRGSVICQNVEGNVDAGGSVQVKGNVSGNVDAGGSVNCGDVAGNVDAGGSVNCRSLSLRNK